jgi:transposase
MNKSNKKKTGVKKITQFEIIRPNVAGIDVSDNAGMMVAYPVNATEIVIEEFGCYTCDLRSLSATLKSHGMAGVAVESTGVYRIPLFLLLQEDGFDVSPVNSRHVNNVTGRKSDEGEAEWLQKLHRCGLLTSCFQPDSLTRNLRSTVRHRTSMVQTRSTYLNRMQKALELMNIKVHTVLSDIDGKSGLSTVKAIPDGERDAKKLAGLCDVRVKAPREETVKSLEGFWAEEHLFELSQCYDLYMFHNKKIQECEIKIEKTLTETVKSKNDGIIPKIDKTLKGKHKNKNDLCINVSPYLYMLTKTDISGADGITGIGGVSAPSIYAETGDDLTRFKTEKHFVSWPGLCPNNKIPGGKIINSRVQKKKNYAGQSFRMAALSLRKNRDPLGDYYRRIRSAAGSGKAAVAPARKLAVIYYRMMIDKTAYNPASPVEYQEKYRKRKIKNMENYLNRLKAEDKSAA